MSGGIVVAKRAAAVPPDGRASPRRRRRLGVLDVVLLAALAGAFGWIAWRVDAVLVYDWHWAVVPQLLVRVEPATGRWVLGLLLQGFAVTLRLAVWGSLLAGLVGVALGLMRVSGNPLLRLSSRLYVELIRNTPPLVFIFVFYFFISSQIVPALGVSRWLGEASPWTLAAIGWLAGDPALLENFLAGLVCLAMLEAAYVAEIVRGGIQSIERGQWEAAAALGLSRLACLRLVILPQAIRRTLPPLASQAISLVKDSSIVSLISIQELTFVAQQAVVSTRRPFEIWLATAALYFLVCLVLSLVFRRLERQGDRGREGAAAPGAGTAAPPSGRGPDEPMLSSSCPGSRSRLGRSG